MKGNTNTTDLRVAEIEEKMDVKSVTVTPSTGVTLTSEVYQTGKIVSGSINVTNKGSGSVTCTISAPPRTQMLLPTINNSTGAIEGNVNIRANGNITFAINNTTASFTYMTK